MCFEGSVLPDGDLVRVNAQLIDAETGGHLWAERFDLKRRDIQQLQDDIVGLLSRAIDLKMIDAQARRSDRERPNAGLPAPTVPLGRGVPADAIRRPEPGSEVGVGPTDAGPADPTGERMCARRGTSSSSACRPDHRRDRPVREGTRLRANPASAPAATGERGPIALQKVLTIRAPPGRLAVVADFNRGRVPPLGWGWWQPRNPARAPGCVILELATATCPNCVCAGSDGAVCMPTTGPLIFASIGQPLDEAAPWKPACGRTFGQWCLHFLWLNFDLAWPPGLREPWLQRPVEAQNNVPAFSGDGLDPVALFARWSLRAKVDVHRFVSVHQ